MSRSPTDPAAVLSPRPPTIAQRLPLLLRTLVLALLAALVCQHLGTPLPWMIGPLLFTAALGVAGVRQAASVRLRNIGLWMIGIALGLYFRPEVTALLWQMTPVLLAGIAWALLMGWGFYRLLLRAQGDRSEQGRATAWFASAIGGASEMAVLAERHGGLVDRVAAAHSLRLLLVVVIIPVAFQITGVHGLDPAAVAVQQVNPTGLVLLLAASGAGIALLARLGLPNPWVLGALGVTLLLTATGVQWSALPVWASNAAQLFLGVTLGTRFTPAFVRAAPRWLAAVALGTVVMIVASAGFAWGLAQLAGLHPATVLLGTSPGGIAEMCITAKVLQLGVPAVTAFHVTRYVAVLVLTAPLYGWVRGRGTVPAG